MADGSDGHRHDKDCGGHALNACRICFASGFTTRRTSFASMRCDRQDDARLVSPKCGQCAICSRSLRVCKFVPVGPLVPCRYFLVNSN